MKKVFIIHGFCGRPNGGWRPWLMGELSKNNIYACALPMPNPDVPIKEEWIEEIKNVIKNPNEDIYLVGHSLGVPAILRYLETLSINNKIGGAVLVSGPIYKRMKEEYESVDKFLETDFDFNHIKSVCNNFSVIHGNNDESVSFREGEDLSRKLSCDLFLVKNGGHLNDGAGCYQ